MDLKQDLERAVLEARVDGVVDQLHDRVGRRAVVGKERGGDGRVDSLADGHTLSHISWKSILDLPFQLPVAAFN
jgi:hypothetical protein